jgi:hypothetical protein
VMVAVGEGFAAETGAAASSTDVVMIPNTAKSFFIFSLLQASQNRHASSPPARSYFTS